MNSIIGKCLKVNKKRVVLASAMTIAMLLQGCGETPITTTTLSIDKDGGVVGTIVENFEESYYNLDELSDMASKEASSYNSDFLSDKVFVDSAQKNEETGTVTITMSYKSTSDYSHFNQVSLFYGTVQEALDKGYNVSSNLVDTNGVPVGENGINDNLDKHIIISTDKSNIIAPYNVLYMSKGTELKSKKEAAFENSTDETVQLLLSK